MCLFQLIKLLDGKRSQAVGILISSLHLEMKDIQQGESRGASSIEVCCWETARVAVCFLSAADFRKDCDRKDTRNHVHACLYYFLDHTLSK